MAQVKFYRGTVDQVSNIPADALGFIAKGSAGTPTTAGDYGYIYLGTTLVATKYLDQMEVSGFGTQPTAKNPRIVSLEYNATKNYVDSRKLVLGAEVADTSTVYTPADTDILTALATSNLITKMSAAADKYHSNGGWAQTPSGGTADAWYTYRSTGTNIADIVITLPIANTSAAGYDYATDTSHLTTPSQVATYFSTLAGGMRYCGALSTNSIPANSRCGDVFIASAKITIQPSVAVDPRTIESGDMVVLNSHYTSGNLAYSGGYWNFDQFERNLDGAIHYSGTTGLTSNTVILGAGTDSVQSLANGTAGQVLKIGSGGTPEWGTDSSDDNYYRTTKDTSEPTKLLVTHYKNGTVVTNDAGDTGYVQGVLTIDTITQSNKVKQTVSTTNSNKPLLIGAGGTSATYQTVSYSSKINANASTGDITAHNITVGGGSGESTIDVYTTLTWQTLTNNNVVTS